MKTRISTLLLTLLLILGATGCLDARPELRNSAGPTISNQTEPVPIREEIDKSADGVKKEITNKQDAIQTNLSALIGASIGKLSDELVHVTADMKDLIHAEITTKIGDIQNQMSASVASNNEIRVMLKNQIAINTRLQASLSAVVKTNANLQSMLDAKVQAIAAVASKIDTTTSDFKQTLNAGHDVVNTTQQFTKEVMTSVVTAMLVALGVVVVMVFGIAFVLVRIYAGQAKDAKLQVQAKDVELRTHQQNLMRALAILPPSEVERMFPKSESNELMSKIIVK